MMSDTDLRQPNTPARRVVGAYAIHRRRPLAHHAVLMISAVEINADINGTDVGTIRGYDHDTALDCPGGGAAAITGATLTAGLRWRAEVS